MYLSEALFEPGISTYTKGIKFMINAFKRKIDTHKAVVMILNNKSDHLINALGICIEQSGHSLPLDFADWYFHPLLAK